MRERVLESVASGVVGLSATAENTVDGGEKDKEIEV